MRSRDFPEFDDEHIPPAHRRLLKERGTLRCEWCGRLTEVRPGYRWSVVTPEEWLDFALDHPVFFCERPSCISQRT